MLLSGQQKPLASTYIMSEDKLTKKQTKELEELTKDIVRDAKKVRLDYEKNPSEFSGSVIQVHEDSPFLATKEERLLKIKKNDSE